MKEGKRNLWLWALYDFANTPLTVAIGGLYLGQWLILEQDLPDFWFGAIFSFSTIALLLTSPFWGAWSDRIGKRMPFLGRLTWVLLLLGLVLAIVLLLPITKTTKIILVLCLFFLIQYVYELSLVFYDALMEKLSSRKTLGKTSGIGDVFAEAGWLFGPAFLLLFASGKVTLFGQPGRTQVFLPATIFLALFGLPMVFGFREPKQKVERRLLGFRNFLKETISDLRSLFKKDKNLTIFLVAYMLISDAILTADLFFAVFLDQIYRVSDNQKVLFLFLLSVFAIPSGYFLGKIGDRLGLKKWLLISCSEIVAIILIISLSSSFFLALAMVCLLGIGWAGFYTLSRALLIRISPPDRLGEYFGFFATFQKFASILGPLIWGGVTSLKFLGVDRYRLAVISMAGLMIVGIILLTKVKEKVIFAHD